jgi:tryptophan-rich sensory protein
MRVSDPLKLLASIGLCQLTGLAATPITTAAIGDWYQNLTKPAFTPPGWIFGPVWTLLYTLMGVSAWLVLRSTHQGNRKGALSLFGVQLVLNFLWSVLFFGLRKPWLAFAEIILLLGAITATALAFWPFSKKAALLLLPYLVWVSFAAALNYRLAALNR